MPQLCDDRFTLGTDAQTWQVVHDGLEAFNVDRIGRYAYSDFALYARHNQEQVVGGMFGHSGLG